MTIWIDIFNNRNVNIAAPEKINGVSIFDLKFLNHLELIKIQLFF